MVALILAMASSQVLAAWAQGDSAETLSLSFRRNFGYALGTQMQGKFTIRAEAPADVTRVEFLLDGQVIGQNNEAPFSLAFDTGAYAEGIHTFSAVGYTADGRQVSSETISRQFVAGNGVVIVVIAIVALVILFRLASYFLVRRSGSKRGEYGLLGGAVCANCGQPFAIHWWSLRLGVGRLDRCPHCGKWHMVRRASADELAAAQELHAGQGETKVAANGESEEEAFRRRLDDSRFDQ